MKINDFQGGTPGKVHGAASKINSPHSKFENRTKESGDSIETQYARDPEVTKLVRQLTESADVRTDRVAELQQQIRSGEFFSRQTAEATAEAFLR